MKKSSFLFVAIIALLALVFLVPVVAPTIFMPAQDGAVMDSVSENIAVIKDAWLPPIASRPPLVLVDDPAPQAALSGVGSALLVEVRSIRVSAIIIAILCATLVAMEILRTKLLLSTSIPGELLESMESEGARAGPLPDIATKPETKAAGNHRAPRKKKTPAQG